MALERASKRAQDQLPTEAVSLSSFITYLWLTLLAAVGVTRKIDSKVEINTQEVYWRVPLGSNPVKMKAREHDWAEVKMT